MPRAKIVSDETLLDAIESFMNEHGYSPTYDEIKDAVGLSSKCSVAKRVSGMAKSGILTFTPGKSRTLRIVNRYNSSRTDVRGE